MNFMEQRVTLITLGVSNLERSIHFYENGLEWKRSDKSVGDMIAFDMPGITFALYPIEELSNDVTLKHNPSRFSGITIAHNTHSENEVDAIMNKVQSIGGSIIKPPQKTDWGGYSGYFADPDGYIFEVAYNPYWKL